MRIRNTNFWERQLDKDEHKQRQPETKEEELNFEIAKYFAHFERIKK